MSKAAKNIAVQILLVPIIVGAVTVGKSFGQSVSPPAKYKYDQRIMADQSSGPPPLKKRVAVARFDDSASVEDSPFGVLDPETIRKHQNDDINSALSKELAVIRQGFTERLITALFSTNRFIVVERRDIHKILREQDFGKSNRVSPEGSLDKGAILQAQFIITGIVTLDNGEATDPTSDSDVEMSLRIPGSKFQTTVGGDRAIPTDPGALETLGTTDGSTMGDRSLLQDMQFNCPRRSKSPAKFALHLRAYDVSTSQIISAVRVSADSQWCLIKAGVQRIILQMDKFPWKTRVASVNDRNNLVVSGGRDVNLSYDYRLTYQPDRSREKSATSSNLDSLDLAILEIGDTSSVTKLVNPKKAYDVRPGDWVIATPAGQ